MTFIAENGLAPLDFIAILIVNASIISSAFNKRLQVNLAMG